MTFPQPNSAQALLSAGSNFFRLRTQVQSAGDIYESEVSAAAIALGPASDLAAVNVYYYDGLDRYILPNGNNSTILDTSRVSSFQISPDRPFVGLVGAQMDQFYPLSVAVPVTVPLSERKGRIIIAPADVIDTAFLPNGYTEDDSIAYEATTIDVIQYLQTIPSIFPQRSDRTYRYQYLAVPPGGGGTDSAWLVVPGYGRKSGYFTFTNMAAIETVTMFLYGVRFSTSNTPGTVGYYQRQLATVALLSLDSTDYNFDSSVDGLWDAFVIELRGYGGHAMPMNIVLSDDAL